MASLPSAQLSLRLKEIWYFCKQLQFVALLAESKVHGIPETLKMLSIYPSSLTNLSSKKLVFVSEVSIRISQVISFELA